MTEREIRQVREQWDRAHGQWSSVCRVIDEMRGLEYDLRLECERLAEIIAEYDNTPIMTTDAAEEHRVVTEDDGEAT